LAPASRLDHTEPGRFQDSLQPFAVGGLVVDDKDARLLASLAPELDAAQAVDELLRRDRLDEVVESAQSDAELGVVDHAHDDDRDVACRRLALRAYQHLPSTLVRPQDFEGERVRPAPER